MSKAERLGYVTSDAPEHRLLNDNHIGLFVGIHALCLTLATAAVVLRFKSRFIAKASCWADDYTTLLGLAFLAALSTVSLLQLRWGYGQHGPEFSRADMVNSSKAIFAFQLIYAPSITIIRSSIILLYLRIFRKARERVIFYVVWAYTGLWFLGIFSMGFAQCMPISYNWDREQKGRCVDIKAFFLASGIANSVGDILVLLAPIRLVWQLHASRGQRVAITCMFALGSFVCIVSLIRFIYLTKALSSGAPLDRWAANILCLIEPHIGLVCACLPVLRPLFRGASQPSQTSASRRSSMSWLAKGPWSRPKATTDSSSSSGASERVVSPELSWPLKADVGLIGGPVASA